MRQLQNPSENFSMNHGIHRIHRITHVIEDYDSVYSVYSVVMKLPQMIIKILQAS